MRALIPQMFWTGISLGINIGLFVPMMVRNMVNQDSDQQFMKSMNAMMAFGFGQICSGIFVGQIMDRFPKKPRIISIILIILITL
jgi:MFS family permease